MLIIKKAVIVTILLLIIGISYVAACSCNQSPWPEHATKEEVASLTLQKADYIFVGKVEAVAFGGDIVSAFLEENLSKDPLLQYGTKFIKLSVTRWWKGPSGSEISLASEDSRTATGGFEHSSCDYNFKAGETYLVFASLRGGFYQNNPCAGTSPSIDKQAVDLLGEGNTPVKIKS